MPLNFVEDKPTAQEVTIINMHRRRSSTLMITGHLMRVIIRFAWFNRKEIIPWYCGGTWHINVCPASALAAVMSQCS